MSTQVLGHNERRIARFRVRVCEGPAVNEECVSKGTELTIGKAEGNDLVLPDPTVSRHHCVVRVTADGIEIEDLGSTNGTTLGGHRIKAAYLTAGCRIGVGESALLFEPLDQDVVEPLSEDNQFGSLIGSGEEMRRLFAIALRVAKTNTTVLLEGETGTGKTLLAEAIHDASPRADAPFVVVDCGAIPPTLIESELFGHEKGAFTGATAAKAGLFESAEGGTVFLDEIGELPIELQPKLLRVLDTREIRRVGSHATLPVDVRVIAATNRDLRREINRGGFRSDLWYRLSTVRLELPPLRQRRADIPLLTGKFYAEVMGADAPVPDGFVESLPRSNWPGNVRELRAAVERAVLFGHQATWDDRDADTAEGISYFDPSTSFRAAKALANDRWERNYLRELMEREGGNISRAARAARMDRSHLRTLLRRHGLHEG